MVHDERGLGCVEVSLRIQDLIAQELIHVSVELVGSGFSHHVDNGAGIPSILGVEGIGDDAEFFHAIRTRLHGRQVNEHVVGISAIDTEIVGAPTPAVHGNTSNVAASVVKISSGLR